jgi:hypothetical protein
MRSALFRVLSPLFHYFRLLRCNSLSEMSGHCTLSIVKRYSPINFAGFSGNGNVLLTGKRHPQKESETQRLQSHTVLKIWYMNSHK